MGKTTAKRRDQSDLQNNANNKFQTPESRQNDRNSVIRTYKIVRSGGNRQRRRRKIENGGAEEDDQDVEGAAASSPSSLKTDCDLDKDSA